MKRFGLDLEYPFIFISETFNQDFHLIFEFLHFEFHYCFVRSEIANIPSLSKFFSNFLVVFKTRYRRNYYKLYLAILQNPILHMNFTFE